MIASKRHSDDFWHPPPYVLVSFLLLLHLPHLEVHPATQRVREGVSGRGKTRTTIQNPPPPFSNSISSAKHNCCGVEFAYFYFNL